jgi:quinol monooxygenase YgiN
MIIELADIRIHPGQNAAFEEAIQRGIATVAARAKGFQGYKVNRGIESPRGFPARAAVFLEKVGQDPQRLRSRE